MPLQTSWVDHLFAKLTVRYGAAFLRQWPDADPALVKADWAEVLDGVRGDSLSYALRFLPVKPPNAIEFRELCRKAPTQQAAALPAPEPKADPARVRALMARLGQRERGPMTDAERCARNIAAIAKARGYLTEPQRAQLHAMGYSGAES